MNTPNTPNLPSAPDLDAAAADLSAKAATTTPHPQATPPAHPEVAEQTSAHGFAPDSLPNPTSHGEGHKGGPTQPSIDTAEFDDAGNKKSDLGIGGEGFGPRGSNTPVDVMTDAERQAVADATDARLAAGMSSTTRIDSAGKPKGQFAVVPQGNDKHGARIPDKIDTNVVVEAAPVHVGPRGAGTPNDSWHGPRPEKK